MKELDKWVIWFIFGAGQKGHLALQVFPKVFVLVWKTECVICVFNFAEFICFINDVFVCQQLCCISSVKWLFSCWDTVLCILCYCGESCFSVRRRPVVRLRHRLIRVYEGRQVVFTCEADGVPLPVVFWTKDHLPIESSSHISLRLKRSVAYFLSADCSLHCLSCCSFEALYIMCSFDRHYVAVL